MEGEGEGVGRRGKREEERGASHLACALGLATWGSGPAFGHQFGFKLIP